MKYNPKFSRRMFLQGLGGYSLTIPILPSLALRAAQAAANAEKKFVMVVGHYGRGMSQRYPNVADAQLQLQDGVYYKKLSEFNKPISYILNSGFNPLLDKISIIRELDSLSTAGNHNSSVPTTGSSLQPHEANGFGYSIDCILEESRKFYQSLPALGDLRVCPEMNHPWHEFASFSFSSKIKKTKE